MSEFLNKYNRTHTCNDLKVKNINETVVLTGWVQSFRDHGGRRFIDLRDRYGITQIIFKPETNKSLHKKAHNLKSEWCIGIVGEVEDRIKNGGFPNKKIKSGEIEINVKEMTIFNKSDSKPFEIKDSLETSEDKRLNYRVLDLRRPILQKNFILRHKLYKIIRKFFDKNNFLEIETPIMVKYTPGGARNFLVPSRLNPGLFFALAESPQLFKQMFMIAGFDRYFQIVKCCRDEDLRVDRQPEFTQIDMEMSFINKKNIMKYTEKLIKNIFLKIMNIKFTKKFKIITYEKAMLEYSSDKPDIRFGLKHKDLSSVIKKLNGANVPFFKEALERNEIIKAMVLPSEYTLSKTKIQNLEKLVKQLGGIGLARAKVDNNMKWIQSPLSKFITNDGIEAINDYCNVKSGDIIFFQFGEKKLVCSILNALRLHLGRTLNLISNSKNPWSILWIIDFPLFEYNSESKKYKAMHHPFTLPRLNEDNNYKIDPKSCHAEAYDLIVNGCEVGGGSIRIHDSIIQKKIFKILNISPKEQSKKFGFLLDSMRFGAPPHGGIALGLDRICMLLCNTDSIRDVIAFPKSQKGSDLLTGAPTSINKEQLDELHIKNI